MHNDICNLHVHCLANQTHFHMKGCAPGLVLKKRQRQLGNGQLNVFFVFINKKYFLLFWKPT